MVAVADPRHPVMVSVPMGQTENGLSEAIILVSKMCVCALTLFEGSNAMEKQNSRRKIRTVLFLLLDAANRFSNGNM